jgi:hypothetical protein
VGWGAGPLEAGPKEEHQDPFNFFFYLNAGLHTC